jgi:HEAT repeat protein
MIALAMTVVLALSDDKEAEEAIQKFKTEMKSPETAVRVSAVTELGHLQHERVMKVLASCLVTDVAFVRIAAAKGLGAFQERKPQATALLAEAMAANSKEPDVQVALLSALKALHEANALSVAYRYLDEKNVKVSEAAIGVTESIHSRASVDPLIHLMKKLATAGDGVSSGDGSFDVPADEALKARARTLQAAANKALQSITGEKWSTAGEWDAWWKRNAGTFKTRD